MVRRTDLEAPTAPPNLSARVSSMPKFSPLFIPRPPVQNSDICIFTYVCMYCIYVCMYAFLSMHMLITLLAFVYVHVRTYVCNKARTPTVYMWM